MSYNLDSLRVSNLVLENSWNLNLLYEVFGNNLNFDYLINDKISSNNENCWVWYPKSRKHKLTSMVYAHFNKDASTLNPWDGWANIWRLKIGPRPKHFLWLLLHNGIKTYDYLYRLNLGPQTFCKFCNLDVETSEHLFNTCTKVQLIWNSVSSALGKQVNFQGGFSSGNWLSPALSEYTKYDQSVFAVVAWLIWKARCILVFQNEITDMLAIPIRAINHVREFSQTSSSHHGKQLILNNFTFTDNPFLFVSSAGSIENGVFGAGFYLTDTNSQLICAGSCSNCADSVLEADALALSSALGSLFASDLQTCTIFIANAELYYIIKDGAS
ncbi:Reverse transcriptase zinc-binding domain-containing protein [Dioscorea alata]|uniref:Reverse transcriptase zinc-binding domain-containing protein n=1 Tax=Dioscorea alata TaxID=55571 RepID=A0ACB7UI83_DIOAL|nr:Reverse transcriptase zinc-binding domain-containing protein [Dioscorea alata]